MPRHYFTVTWDQLHRDARALAWRLIGHAPFAGSVVIARGGLIPAAIVAREMEVRLVETVSVVAYGREQADWTEFGKPEVVKLPVAAGDGEGFLLIDDLVDTGTTARVVRALLPNAHFATVYSKPTGRSLVDTYITEVSQDTWIMFPWDTEPQFAVPLAKREKREE
jgi:xanthine phosphoribosyltransferase